MWYGLSMGNWEHLVWLPVCEVTALLCGTCLLYRRGGNPSADHLGKNLILEIPIPAV